MKKRDPKMQIGGAIDNYQKDGVPGEEIVAKLTVCYSVTPEHVRAIMDEMEEDAA